jgi:hypothetical protein
LLGLFTILRGDTDNRSPVTPGRPKPNNVCVGFSRDGFHWQRPDRTPFLDYSEVPAWNWGNVQSVGGGCLVVGDKLYFYVSGRRGTPESRDSGGSTGLAILRRDGFASMDAAEQDGTLTTRPVVFRGNRLFVNFAAPQGALRVEVLDEAGKPLSNFSADQCEPLQGDSTLQAVTWRGAEDLSALQNKPVRFRFHVRGGSLFSFWVSPHASGASFGYVAAGGPGYTSHKDTRGRAALAEARSASTR